MTGTISPAVARKVSIRTILGVVVGGVFLGASQYVESPFNAYFRLVGRTVLYVVTAFFLGMLIREDFSSRDAPEVDVLSTLFAPASILHELAHAVTATAFGGSVEFARREDGRFGVDVDNLASAIGRFLTALAPTLIGVALLVAAQGWIAAAVFDPSVGAGASIVRVVATAYLVWFSWPSMADLAAAVAANKHAPEIPS